jgi:hypothetical protein
VELKRPRPVFPNAGELPPLFSYYFDRFYPWRIQLSVGSAIPVAVTTGGMCWQSHQVPPGQSS